MQAVPRNRKDERASDDFEAGLVRGGGGGYWIGER